MIVTGSEVTRKGYALAGLPALDGAASGLTSPIYRYASTEKPSAQEVLFAFGQLSAADAFLMRPWIKQAQSSFDDSWVLLDESTGATISGTITADDFTVPLLTGSATNDYYNGWLAKNETRGNYAYIVDYDGGTKILTTKENIGSNGLNWQDTDTLFLQRWFHDQPGIDPQYDFPFAHSIYGDFRVGGGKGSSVGNKDIWIGYLNRTFFPTEAEAFTYQGTYASRREIRVPYSGDSAIDLSLTFAKAAIAGTDVALDTGYTYALAIAAVYDKYQISPYISVTGQYFIPVTDASKKMSLTLNVRASTLNKRITAFRIYVAQIQGDVSALNPSTFQYYFLREVSIIDSTESGWAYTGSTTQQFTHTYSVDKTEFNKKGNLWGTDSGYAPVDTTFSHDLEVAQGGRQFIGRVYKYTDAKEDLDTVFTNPRSAAYGQIQPDIFADEPDVFTNRILWGDSSYLASLLATEKGTLLALKDRAVVDVSFNENADGTLNFFSSVISTQVGCASKTGAITTPHGQFFAGYDDIYWYNNGSLTALTLEDWQDVYAAISTANKQAAIMWFRVEDSGVYVQLSTAQYAFYIPLKTWREISYAHAMTYYTVKRDNTVVWTKSDGTAYKFDTSSTDAGTAIPARWRTGYFKVFQSGIVGTVPEVFVNKHQTSTSGILDCIVLTKHDGTVVTTNCLNIDQTSTRLRLPIAFPTNSMFDYIQIEYNEAVSDPADPEVGVVEFGEIEVPVVEKLKRVPI